MKRKAKPVLKISDLPLRTLAASALMKVSGGLPVDHDCATGSGGNCVADDCGPIPVGSQCG